MNVTKASILLFMLGAVAWMLTGTPEKESGLGSDDDTPAGELPAHVPGPPVVPMPPGRWYNGMGMQLYSVAAKKPRFIKALREMADMGATAVLMGAAGSQEHAGSETIFVEEWRVPSAKDFGDLIDEAHRLGMAVILMPIVLLTDPRNDDEWRGTIAPGNWDRWFASYLKFVKLFGDVGREHGAEALMVGSELISTEKFTPRWRRLIAEVREFFPGQLAYSANWDHYDVVKFWDDLDFVGMTTYHTLSDKENPELSTLLDAWKPVKKDILSWRRHINRPIVFTEVGWCSQDGASTEPWNYYHQDVPKATKTGLIEQQRCYTSFVKTWQGEQNIAGGIWWEYKLSAGTAADIGYDPRGKPAEKVMRGWLKHYRRKAKEAAAAAPPTTRPGFGPAG